MELTYDDAGYRISDESEAEWPETRLYSHTYRDVSVCSVWRMPDASCAVVVNGRQVVDFADFDAADDYAITRARLGNQQRAGM